MEQLANELIRIVELDTEPKTELWCGIIACS
jgi:hypothetical protein